MGLEKGDEEGIYYIAAFLRNSIYTAWRELFWEEGGNKINLLIIIM